MFGYLDSPAGKIFFKDLDMAMLYDPLEKSVTVHYVYYNTLRLDEMTLSKHSFISTALPLKRLFSHFYSSLFQQHFG